MKSLSYNLRSCGLVSVLLIFLLGLNATPGIAQENKQEPTVSVTLCIVDETIACQPNGYQNYDSCEPSRCQTLTPRDLKTWERRGFTQKKEDIPPTKISLRGALLRILYKYTAEDIDKKPPTKRLSLVMMFEWQVPQTGKVSLTRKNPNRVPPIPDLTWPGTLNGEKHWIHHERADAFLPSYNIEWTLNAGGHEWVFTTGN